MVLYYPEELIKIKAAAFGCGQVFQMSPRSKIAEQLRAHAALCEKLANEVFNEEAAARLRKMARDCIEAARAATEEQTPLPVPARIRKS